MYKKFLFCLTLMLICGLNLGNANIEVGYLYLGDNGPFTKPALEFAKDTFSTTELGKGDIKSDKFKNFAVVWWNEGDTDPGALSNAEIDAFMNYAESGGAILLTGWAIRYATPMGLEDAEARQFGPEVDDGQNVGITVLQETLDQDLVQGLKNIDGQTPEVGDRIQVNSTGFPKSGDYYNNLWKNFITLANAWGPPANDWGAGIAAFGYWEAGDGKVFNMNWRLPNYHANNKSIDQLHQLTENVINWLASESAYLDVSSHGKLPVVWGNLKNQR